MNRGPSDQEEFANLAVLSLTPSLGSRFKSTWRRVKGPANQKPKVQTKTEAKAPAKAPKGAQAPVKAP